MDASRSRILLVDDQEGVNGGFRTLLTRQAWIERCVTATTREQSLGHARRYQPHVALVDLILGDDSGADVARAIRAMSPSTKVLLLAEVGRPQSRRTVQRVEKLLD